MAQRQAADNEIRIESRFYAPGESQSRHRDPEPRVSIVVEGEFAEETARFAGKIAVGAILMKSPEGAHATKFGAAGATIVSLILREGDFNKLVAPLSGGWRLIDRTDGVRAAAGLLEAVRVRSDCAIKAALADCPAADAPADRRARIPPLWLARLRDELQETGLRSVDVAAVGRSAGVHAAHVSRLFRQVHGESISDFARRHAVRRAMNALSADETTLAAAAAAAGFYDQSHMNRAFRAVAGVTPLQWRRLAANLESPVRR